MVLAGESRRFAAQAVSTCGEEIAKLEKNVIRKERVMKKLLMLVAIVMSVFSVTACNTMQGAGEDIERGGEKIQDAADR